MRTAAAGLMIILAGCATIVEDSPDETITLVMWFTLTNLGEGDEASPGPHCATAVVYLEHVEVERQVWTNLGSDRPFMIVKPRLNGSWVTIGNEAYATPLPLAVPTGIQGETEPVGIIEWQDGLLVDGTPRALPHEWSKTDNDGAWRINAVIDEGPRQVRTFNAGSCA